MPTNTPNLNLIKPLVSENYTVAVANANNDILDTAVGGLAPQATTYTKDEVDTQVGLLAPKANPVFTGTQTLPNIVTNGIKFPVTQVPSADANTLDDYEEGSFTPNIIGLTTTGTGNVYAIQSGVYTKVGNLVTAFGRVSLSTKGNATGLALISGLPFSIKSITARVKGHIPQVANVTGITIDNLHGTYLFNASGQGSFVLADSTGNGVDFSKITNATLFDFLATYVTD